MPNFRLLDLLSWQINASVCSELNDDGGKSTLLFGDGSAIDYLIAETVISINKS